VLCVVVVLGRDGVTVVGGADVAVEVGAAVCVTVVTVAAGLPLLLA
jgi:hypothetical protein